MHCVMIIGASGAIGGHLVSTLRENGFNVVAVAREPTATCVGIAQVLSEDPKKYSLVVDASTASLNDYIKLVNWLKRPQAPVLVHFSSVRAELAPEKDGYGIYKRGVLLLLREIASKVLVIRGDLFSFRNRLVGYWRFVTDVRQWTMVSSRVVEVADVEHIAGLLGQIASGAAPPVESGADEFLSLRVDARACKRIQIVPMWVDLLFRLRLNALLRPFRLCVVP